MKRKFWKYILKSFKHDFSRIFTITSIVGLGIGFLVGLLSTTPDLFATMDSYYDKTNFSDVTIRSTIGFSDDTEKQLMDQVSDISSVMLTYEEENYLEVNDAKVLGKFTYRSFKNQTNNTLTLEEGRYPKNDLECVMLVGNNALADYRIGSKIEFTNSNGELIKASIVGSVRDPNYITYQTEQSYITGGTIEAYVYFDSDLFDQDFIYTNAYVTFNKTKKMNSYSGTYSSYIKDKITEINNASKEILDQRLVDLKKTIEEEAQKAAEQQIRDTLESIGITGTVQDSIINSIINTDLFKDLVNQKADEIFNEQIQGITPTWYVLDRDTIKSAYVFKTDALKVQTIALIFPPFFFLIALLVCLSSMSRIITKDRQIIGTFKALGFTKKRISLKYVLYGAVSSLLGCIVGVAIGLFAIPAALMYVYKSIYYFPSMSFVFTPGYVIGFSSLMIGMIIAAVLVVVMSNLKEPAAQLMLGGKSPKPGKKILLERIPFIWNHLKFKYKSMFRNIFRFKKNLLMMIIGVGGCTGMLLTGFGIQDSFSVISNEQYQTIIKYDAIVTTNTSGLDPNLIFGEDETVSYGGTIYLHGTCMGDETISVEIFGSNSDLTTFVGLYDSHNREIEFNGDSVIISSQIADELHVGVNDTFQLDTDFGTKNVVVTGICQNYVSNYVYFGENAYNRYFENIIDNTTFNAYLVSYSDDLSDEQLEEKLNVLTDNENVKAVIATTSTRQTYDSIVQNLSMIVLLITVLSGCLAAIVIYNLTDININERIREIATLRVCGYRRREVLMYIVREIFFMSLIGILIGLGIGVFLHWFIMINISSIGIYFSTTINWSSYLITMAISAVFVVGISMCFYPKIRSVSMTESLKSVD